MGKRELIIIATFIAVGIVAYQLTAAPPAEGRRRFSLSTVLDEFRRESRDRRATASFTTDGAFAAPASLTDLRISSVAHVTIRGEPRDDIRYTLTVESGGADQEAARAAAARTTLAEDRPGPVLALRANAPSEGRHVASLTLVVPERLRVRVEGTPGGATLEADRLAGVELENIVGDVRLGDVTGPITGTHRNGTIAIADSGAVNLTLVASQATLSGSRGTVALTLRDGRCQVTDAGASIEIASTNNEVVITRPAAAVRLTGSGGRATIDAPRQDVFVDMRRTVVDVALADATPVTALTTDAPLTLRVIGTPSLQIDALASDGGAITGDGLTLATETTGRDTRARHAFDTGTVPVALRNRRAPIVISATK